MKAKKSVQQQVQENHPEFAEEVSGLTGEQVNSRLAQLAKDLDAVEDARDADEGLAKAQVEAFELGASYREAKKAVKLKSKYLIALLKDRGE